jgi:tRNA (mo5U34)-methyltransferase
MSPPADMRERAAAIKWFHSIELAPGFKTPGLDDTAERVGVLHLPVSLQGKTVLDVGAWDGFFSFEAERRGASRVLATDSFAWDGENWSDKRGFELARECLDSRVEDHHVDVLSLSPEAVGGTFDVVLCLGVLYHMKHPLLMCERVASVTGELLILETHVDMTWTSRPAAAFYPSHELGLDPTNWWGPNVPAVVGMLRAAGFQRVEVVSGGNLARNVARSTRRAVRYGAHLARHRARPPEHPAQGRCVVHAFK